ncbi:MAG TPA: type II toxin-antitoxin system VapC family toxin [Bryobacteraceae bacterium]|nr:type II toxin-antitoxin system VapC family toxin [Bryobacteraceae bacterium]
MSYLIDSDVLIDISRGKQAAQEFVDSLPESWAISQVSALELIVGARDNRDLSALHEFLSAFSVVSLSDAIGALAYELLRRHAKSHGLHVFDSLIAATAIEQNLTLVTKNQRHFAMLESLRVHIRHY